MSTSCTSAAAAAAATVSTGSSNFHANSPSNLYATVNLQSDMSSGAEVNVPLQEHISIVSSVQHLRVASLPQPTSNSTRSASRRNKRKNFQPRNIRSGGLADDDADDDDNEDNENNMTGSACNNEEDLPTPQEDSYLATFESKTIINSRHASASAGNSATYKDTPLDLSEVVSSGRQDDALRDDLNDNNQTEEQSNSSRTSSRNSQHEVSSAANFKSNQQNKDGGRGRAVDLTLRHPTSSESEDNDDVEKEGSTDNADLKIRYLLWQQQQSHEKNKLSESSTSTSTESQQIRLLQQCVQQQLTGGMGSTSRADMSTLSEYVQTMRELLGFYGLPKHTATKILPPSSGEFAVPQRSNHGDAHSTFRSGVAPATASANQPPTPPHTPKMMVGTGANNGHPISLAAGPLNELGSLNEPSLLGLQSQMHAASRATSTRSALSSPDQPSASSKKTPVVDKPVNYDFMSSPLTIQSVGSMLPPDMKHFTGHNSYSHIKAMNGDVTSGIDDQHNKEDKHFKNNQKHASLTDTEAINATLECRTNIKEVSGSCSSRSGGSGGSSNKNNASIDYSRYVKRFANALECGSPYCKDLNYREHFHCLDCHPRVFVKKEEMIRHFKWHKKRDESLQHGFMRYSPSDDCNDRYRGCPHNHKQTHYHCVKESCDKVYISTSDVQMHANYHRKDSAIIQEGFQRFRATEDCATPHCAFNGQRTTHFHCRRAPCNYTFKNKADMEKHKSYHIKDEQLTRDGFKKFMKNEDCQYSVCRFSRVCNHIHCIREGCNYVLHSSGQLYSHKRKHERRDAELAFHGSGANQTTSITTASNDSNSSGSFHPPGSSAQLQSLNPSSEGSASAGGDRENPPPSQGLFGFPALELPRLMNNPSLAAFFYGRMPSSLNCQLEEAQLEHRQQINMRQSANNASEQSQRRQDIQMVRTPSPVMSEEDAFRLCIARFESGKPCEPGCGLHPMEHFHCRSDGCIRLSFKSIEAAKEHWRNHEQQEHVTDNYYITVELDEEVNPCPKKCQYQNKQRHFHCCWEGCSEIVLASDKPFRRLDHYKMHEFSRRGHPSSLISSPSSHSVPPSVTPNSSGFSNTSSSSRDFFTTSNSPLTTFSLDSMFRRKRGRPPKNRIIEVWNESSPLNSGAGPPDTPQAIFTSFKLPKPNTPPLASQHSSHSGPSSNPNGSSFPLSNMHLFSSTQTPPVHQVGNGQKENKDELPIPSVSPERKEHKTISRKSSDKSSCYSQSRSVSPNQSIPSLQSPTSESPSKSTTVVKAAGTFYPLSAFPSKSDALSPLLAPPTPMLPVRHSERDSSSPLISQEVKNNSPLSSSSNSSSSLSPSPVAATMADFSLNTATAAVTAALISDQPSVFGPDHSCGRPFCKLKRREHYHCVVCNQAFSEIDRLKPHIMKHCSGALSPTINQLAASFISSGQHALSGRLTNNEQHVSQVRGDTKHADLARLAEALNNPAGPSSTLNSNKSSVQEATFNKSSALHALSNFMLPMGHQPFGLAVSLQQNGPGSMFPPGAIYNRNILLGSPFEAFGRTSPGPAVGATPSNNKRQEPLAVSPVDHSDFFSPEAKKMRFQSSMRILKDEPVPDGYVRFRFNEDCKYSHCGYREHQTHFHCMRPDCGYSFCDKTRFVQHTARHERLDTLMGGDFQQYRANVGCGRPECIYTANLGTVQNKASHFHCLKCDFVCTDTNKVVAHRRQHQKTDSILAAGFEKFTPSQNCRVDNCLHSSKQTHYHCLKCSYAVLGLAQMSAHKYRHLEQSSTS